MTEITLTCHYEARSDPSLLAGFGIHRGDEVVKGSNKENRGCHVIFFGKVPTASTNADDKLGPTKQQCKDAYKKLSAGNSASLQISVAVSQDSQDVEQYQCNIWDYKNERENFGHISVINKDMISG